MGKQGKRIVGLRDVSYVSKRSGKPVDGLELHYTYEDERVSGICAGNEFINKRNVAVPELKLGQYVELYYDKYKNVNAVSIVA